MLLIRSLLVTLLAAMVWAQEPEAEPVPTMTTMPQPSPEPEPVSASADLANPMVSSLDTDIVSMTDIPHEHNMTAPVMNATEAASPEPTPTAAAAPNVTTPAPSAAPQVGALSAAMLCLLATLVVS
uniref:Uncharacterized protein n=1 Tax=Graphocephala atropunctata TaxID=36148 RepID=A0A1B6M981_9HEMI